jgi:hypothetical protein
LEVPELAEAEASRIQNDYDKALRKPANSSPRERQIRSPRAINVVSTHHTLMNNRVAPAFPAHRHTRKLQRPSLLVHYAAAIGVALLSSACASTPPKKAAEQPPQASRDDSRQVKIPSDLQDEVERSTEIGRMLFTLDTISAVGTDILLANVKDPASKRIGGYLTLPDIDQEGTFKKAFVVSFFTQDEPPRIAYEIRFAKDSKPTFEAFDPPKAASSKFADLVHVRQVAIKERPKSSQPINPVLIPGAARGENGVLVYLLAGTKEPNIAVFGQHFLALVPYGGTSATYIKPLANSVLELPTVTPDGEKPALIAVSHLVTDYPLETHVFTSLLFGIPLVVMTKRGEWQVDGARISLLRAAKQ